MPLPYKLHQRIIHLFRMTRAQEMLSVLYNHQVRVRRVLEHFYFLFRVGDGVHRITRTVKPHDRTPHIEESPVQPVSFS